MLTLIVITVVLVLSARSDAASYSRCCGPPQYMGGFGSSVGESPSKDPFGINILQIGAWDFTNRRFGTMMNLVFSNGTTSQFRLIQNYKEGTEWIFIDKYQYCEKLQAPQPEPSNCIPDDASFGGSLYIGGNGTDAILVDTWYKTFNEGTLFGGGSMTVKSKDCFPMSSQFMGESTETGDAVPMIVSSGWFNITIGIPDPDAWFTLPSYCSSQETNAVKHPFIHGLNVRRNF